MPNYPGVRLEDFQLDTDEEVRIFKQKIRYALENIPYTNGIVPIYKDNFFDVVGRMNVQPGKEPYITIFYKTSEKEEYDFMCGTPCSVDGDKTDLGYGTCCIKSTARCSSEFIANQLLKKKRELLIQQDKNTQAFLEQIKHVFSNIYADDKAGKVLLDNDFFKLVVKENKKGQRDEVKVDIDCISKKEEQYSGIDHLYFDGKDIGGNIVLDYDEEEAMDAFGRAYYAYKEREKAKHDPRSQQVVNTVANALRDVGKLKEGDIIYEDRFCKLCAGKKKEYYAGNQIPITFFNKITQEYYYRNNSVFDDYYYLFSITDDDNVNMEQIQELANKVGFMHYLSLQREEQLNNQANLENNNVKLEEVRIDDNENFKDNVVNFEHTVPPVVNNDSIQFDYKIPTVNSINSIKSNYIEKTNNEQNIPKPKLDVLKLNLKNNKKITSNDINQKTDNKKVPTNNTTNVVKPSQTKTNNNGKQETKKENKSYFPSFLLGTTGAVSFGVGIFKKDNKIVLIVACSICAVCLIGCVCYSVYVYRNNKNNKPANNSLHNDTGRRV